VVLTIDHTRGNQVSLNWLLYDGHGNLVRTLSPDYTLSAFQWRGVWGEGQGSLGTGRGYCANLGHPEDETGLVYMRARYYEPATGRFISEDPARDGVNWYLYADGNPVNKVDEDGRNPVVLAAVYILISGLVSGLMTALLSGASDFGSFMKNFFRDFVEGAIVALATLGGPLVGMVVGGLVGLADAWLTGGNLVAGAVLGAFGGGLGGIFSVFEAAAERTLLLYLLMSVDVGMLTADATAYAGLFS
jgi:RHS repeat-associated protein